MSTAKTIDVEALTAYKSQTSDTMKEFPDYNTAGKLLVMRGRDYDMMWPAHHGHFRVVQLTERGNFRARLPLDRRLRSSK